MILKARLGVTHPATLFEIVRSLISMTFSLTTAGQIKKLAGIGYSIHT